MFEQFCAAVNKAKKIPPFTGTLLALDPGETTGWAVFDGSGKRLTKFGQIKTWPAENMVEELTKLFDSLPTIDHVVYELYSIYEWKTDSHTWSQVPTLRIIGCIETLCIQRGIPYSSQTAQVAKVFCTDDKLKSWGMYPAGQKHARDAIRHGTYCLMFGQNNSR